MSPATIVTGVGTPDVASMRIKFGAYTQAIKDLKPSNTLCARPLGTISLTPTGNAQGDFHFMSLATGARLSRHRRTELPLPDTAIARVEALAFADNQPLIQDTGFVVEWHPDHPINASENDAEYSPPVDSVDDLLDAAYDPIDASELTDLATPSNDADHAGSASRNGTG
jgi:hypothetical protein